MSNMNFLRFLVLELLGHTTEGGDHFVKTTSSFQSHYLITNIPIVKPGKILNFRVTLNTRVTFQLLYFQSKLVGEKLNWFTLRWVAKKINK